MKVAMDMYCVVICLPICVCVCEHVCVKGLSVLGLVLMVWLEQSVPGDVVMTHRAVLPAPSQQLLSHASFSHNQHTWTQTHIAKKCTHKHTHTGFRSLASVHAVLELATPTNLEHMLLLKLNQTCLHSQSVSWVRCYLSRGLSQTMHKPN